MRIAHIDTQMSWRGGERQALELIKGLNNRGVENILVCKPGSEIGVRAAKVGINVVYMPLRGEWDVFSAMQLHNMLKHEKISLVHAHTSHAHTLAWFAVHGLDNCRLIVSRRVDFHIKSYFSKTFKYGPHVDRILTVSDAIRRVLIEDGIEESRVTTVRSGFVSGQFDDNADVRDLRAELGISKDAVVIVNVAALAPHKSQTDLLKAAAIVVQKHPDVRFLIAGEGELRKTLEKNSNSLGLGDSVIFLGFIKDIEAVFKAADIFAMSSSEEGLGTSILDAMYFNLPIVTTNAGGIPEIVLDGINGLIVPVADFEQLADKVCQLIEDPARREKMGKRSADILHDNTIDNTIDKTLGVYREVLDNS